MSANHRLTRTLRRSNQGVVVIVDSVIPRTKHGHEYFRGGWIVAIGRSGHRSRTVKNRHGCWDAF